MKNQTKDEGEKAEGRKVYDLETRTTKFAQDVRELIRRLPVTFLLKEDGKQVVRSSGSVGANYLEANEGLSRKDFILRLKISKKEARETAYWLRVMKPQVPTDADRSECERLTGEAEQFVRIFGSIITKFS